jgi:hemerythrin-like domain-containing protein
MHAIQLLKKEHETAKQMFARIRSASGGERGQLWSQLQPELKVHEQVEEAALYGPVAQEAGSSDETLQEWHQQHHEEVADLEAMIQEVNALDPAGEEWMEKIEEIQQTLEDHIEEEEGEIWPRIEQKWDQSRLERAGQDIEAQKRQKRAA